MQFLTTYCDVASDQAVTISAEQGSAFAKGVAGDFNPIHDPESKRFCVPGDLLFAIALSRYGLHQTMSFEFLDMVAGDSTVVYPQMQGGEAQVLYEESAKPLLAVKAEGNSVHTGDVGEEQFVNMIRNYVSFSGQNFPHILLPLMEEQNVMINPARPLVIYQSMSFSLDTLDFTDIRVELTGAELNVEGKRGQATLNFSFYSNDSNIGQGSKQLVLSGLRGWDSEVMQALCDEYLSNKV